MTENEERCPLAHVGEARKWIARAQTVRSMLARCMALALLGFGLSACDGSGGADKGKLLSLAGLRVADRAAVDALTGWPQRVVHEKSGAVLVLVPAGTFEMGASATEEGRDSDELQHERVIRKPFYLGETEVTQAQWERVMGNNPSRFRGADLPVENVSWNDCQEFLRKAGGGLRLPSEAEWEYACRAGTTTPFSFGATITPEQVNFDGRFPYGNASKGTYRQQTVACRSLPANAWGLHEMHGNVWEWCQDVQANYPGHGDERAWEEGFGARVLRGGSWYGDGRICRAAFRYGHDPDYRTGYLGLRLARTLPE